MYVIGRAGLAWTYRVLTVAVEQGSRLLARLADAGGNSRPVAPGHVEGPDRAISGGGAPQLAVADDRSETAPPTPERPAPPQQGNPAREAAAAALTPAVVRRWAQEQGIQIGDRGRIARSVMEQYLAGKVTMEPGHRDSRGASTARRSRSGRRSSAA